MCGSGWLLTWIMMFWRRVLNTIYFEALIVGWQFLCDFCFK